MGLLGIGTGVVDLGTTLAPELHGAGEDRPSRVGRAEIGVFDMDVGAVDVERRLVEDADIGVYGDGRGYGDLSSLVRPDFGGTSGGPLPDLNLEDDG